MSLLPLLSACGDLICCVARQKGMIRSFTFKPSVVLELGLKGEPGSLERTGHNSSNVGGAAVTNLHFVLP